MVALFVHRLLGNPAIHRIAEARHQLVVFIFRLVLLLLEAVQHDVRVADSLEPGQPSLDLFRIGRPPGREREAFRPAGGVLVLLLGEAQQDVAALRIGFPFGEELVGMRGFYLALPHLLDRRDIRLVDRAHPTNLSKRTIVAMPATISTTWRTPFASTCPRCRSGMRSDIAM